MSRAPRARPDAAVSRPPLAMAAGGGTASPVDTSRRAEPRRGAGRHHQAGRRERNGRGSCTSPACRSRPAAAPAHGDERGDAAEDHRHGDHRRHVRVVPPRPGADARTRSTSSLRRLTARPRRRRPASGAPGRIYVTIGGRRSKSYGPITIVAYAPHPPAPRRRRAGARAGGRAGGSPFAGHGMWIWYVSQSDGGTSPASSRRRTPPGSRRCTSRAPTARQLLVAVLARARAELHANGLKVCAWQYVYGTQPSARPTSAREAVGNGADCL